MAVSHHAPWRVWILRVLLLVLVAAGVYTSFEYGRFRAGYDREASARAIAGLNAQLAAAETENQGLREQVALLERSRDIDQQARTQVKGNLSDLQDEILELREELAFYRGIVSPEDSASGLKIQDFSLRRGPQNGLFRYKLVLIQAIQHDRRATGTVNLVFHGVRDGEPVRLGLKDLSLEKSEALNYSFRYFQDFEGDLVLPNDFTPGRVEVAILPAGRAADAIRKTFEWPSFST